MGSQLSTLCLVKLCSAEQASHTDVLVFGTQLFFFFYFSSAYWLHVNVYCPGSDQTRAESFFSFCFRLTHYSLADGGCKKSGKNRHLRPEKYVLAARFSSTYKVLGTSENAVLIALVEETFCVVKENNEYQLWTDLSQVLSLVSILMLCGWFLTVQWTK